MPRKQKPIPPNHTKAKWAKIVTDTVLDSYADKTGDNEHRDKLPRAVFIRLAEIAFLFDNEMREDKQAQTDLLAAMLMEFGMTIDFLARVRKIWFEELGADADGNLGAQREKRVLPPRAVSFLLRHPDVKAWMDIETAKHGTAPKHDDIADHLSKMLRSECKTKTVKDGMEAARKADRRD